MPEAIPYLKNRKGAVRQTQDDNESHNISEGNRKHESKLRGARSKQENTGTMRRTHSPLPRSLTLHDTRSTQARSRSWNQRYQRYQRDLQCCDSAGAARRCTSLRLTLALLHPALPRARPSLPRPTDAVPHALPQAGQLSSCPRRQRRRALTTCHSRDTGAAP